MAKAKPKSSKQLQASIAKAKEKVSKLKKQLRTEESSLKAMTRDLEKAKKREAAEKKAAAEAKKAKTAANKAKAKTKSKAKTKKTAKKKAKK